MIGHLLLSVNRGDKFPEEVIKLLSFEVFCMKVLFEFYIIVIIGGVLSILGVCRAFGSQTSSGQNTRRDSRPSDMFPRAALWSVTYRYREFPVSQIFHLLATLVALHLTPVSERVGR